MNKKIMIIIPLLIAAAVIAAVYANGSGTVKTSSKLTIHEKEYVGGFAGMSYKDLRTLSDISPMENRTVYRNLQYGISMKACDISDESLTLKFSDRAFVNGEEREDISLNKGDEVYISFASATTGIDLEVKYD